MAKTLLVGWDGADWDIARPLMAAGQMPCLSALVAAGSSGDLTSFAPFLSPMVWTSIATGQHPDRHGVHHFAEVDPATGCTRAIGSHSRQTPALWNMLSDRGQSVAVVGWMGSFPAEQVHGTFVADSFGHAPADAREPWPVTTGSVYPPHLAEELAELRLRPTDVDPGLLGLFLADAGIDPDELKHDPHGPLLLRRLAQLYSLHNAAVAVVADGQADLTAVYFHFLDLICHDFVVYHPPRHPRANPSAFARYRQVVTGAYRLQDALLADLLRHCQPDTRVLLVSDHGFKTGEKRPARLPTHDIGLADWHRREGIVVAHGPSIRPGALATVRPFDVVPTILAWHDLPVGADLPGRVLTETLDPAPALNVIPTWTNLAPTVPPPGTAAATPEANEAHRLTQRFIQLGYLDPATLHDRAGGEKLAAESASFLGIALRDLGRPADALPHLQAAAWADPESLPRATELGRCLLDLELGEEAEIALQPVFDYGREAPAALLLQAQIKLVRRDFSATSKLIDQLASTELAPAAEGLRRLLLLRAGRFEAAYTNFQAEISRGTLRPNLFIGLAQACLWTGRHIKGAAAAERALALEPTSLAALTLRDELARCQQTAAATPPPPSWDLLAQTARQRITWRNAYHDRAQRLQEGRVARRQVSASASSLDQAPVLIVSGAPRSGTSLMLRMLALAGIPVLTDGARPPDESNLMGYFEWEPIKQLSVAPSLINRAAGKAVKVVSPLLAALPPDRSYDVIFMRRDPDAILASQEAMIRAQADPTLTRLTAAELDRHLDEVLAWARNSPFVRLLEIDFHDLVTAPENEIARLIAFVGKDRLKRPGALRRAIQPELYHQQPASLLAHA